MSRVLLFITLSLVLAADLSAQYGNWTQSLDVRGGRYSNFFPKSLTPIGDQDGDGIEDILLGDTNFAIGTPLQSGRIQIVSGKDGSVIRQILGFAAYGRFGDEVSAAGDVDGDGIEDSLVYASLDDNYGLSVTGAVYLFAGSDGHFLRSFRQSNPMSTAFGGSISSFRDFDGDGFDDFLIGSPAEDFAFQAEGVIRVYSGATGAVLLEIKGGFDSAFLGRRVASGGDFDGDGIVDILSGTEGVQLPGGILYSGAARVFSGRNGQELFRWGGDQREGAFGSDVDFLGDVDGDGHDEVIIGAASGGTGFNTGTVDVFQGGTGNLLFHHEHRGRNAQLGDAVAGLGDVDGDSIPDYVGGAWGVTGAAFATGEALVFSGADGFVIGRMRGEHYYSSLGWDVAGIADTNGDGRAEVLVGEPGFQVNSQPAGRARVESLNPFLQVLPGSLQASSSSAQAIDVHLDYPISAAGHPYQVLASASRRIGLRMNPLDIPLDDGKLLRRTLSADYSDFPFSSGMTGSINAQGQGSAILIFPPHSPLLVPGSTLYLAAVTFDTVGVPEGVSLSMPVRIE